MSDLPEDMAELIKSDKSLGDAPLLGRKIQSAICRFYAFSDGWQRHDRRLSTPRESIQEMGRQRRDDAT